MYDEFFKPNMEMQGYKGVYKRRTGEEKQDGCAIFYHAEKFELKKTLPVDFNRGVDILDRDNVALLIMLQPKKVRGDAENSGLARVINRAFLVVRDT